MLTRKLALTGLACLFLLVASPASSAQPGWVYLGEANVDGNADHDKISVGDSKGAFRALQIWVERAPIAFQRLVVHYENGADEEIPIAYKISPGGKTRVINLRGTDRLIRSVEVWYARASYSSDKPKLRLFGRR